MKTMTCKDLGGPCGLEHRGGDADAIIKAQDAHLKAMVADGDEVHAQARNDMKARWRKPWAAMSWYKGVKRDFAQLPDEA